VSIHDNLPDGVGPGDKHAPWNEPDEDEWNEDEEQRLYDWLCDYDWLLFGFPSSTGNHA